MASLASADCGDSWTSKHLAARCMRCDHRGGNFGARSMSGRGKSHASHPYSMSNFGPDMQLEIYSRSLIQPKDSSAPSALPISFEEWEAKARAALADGPYWYVAGGAGAGDTMRANREAFFRWQIRPKVASDVSVRDIGVTLFGKRQEAPFLLAPVGVQGILHTEGELAVARAAAATG